MGERFIDAPDLRGPDDETVRFRGGPLSNFFLCDLIARHPFTGKMVKYLTVEHRFQAMKTTSYEDHEYVRNARTAREAKERGRRMALDPLWEFAKVNVMREALVAKANASPEFVAALVATGEREVIEDAPWDAEWGSGKDGKGKNLLGRLLMELRDKIRREAGTAST